MSDSESVPQKPPFEETKQAKDLSRMYTEEAERQLNSHLSMMVELRSENARQRESENYNILSCGWLTWYWRKHESLRHEYERMLR